MAEQQRKISARELLQPVALLAATIGIVALIVTMVWLRQAWREGCMMSFVEFTEGTGTPPGAENKQVLVYTAHVVKVEASPGVSTPKTTTLTLINGQSVTVVGEYADVAQMICGRRT